MRLRLFLYALLGSAGGIALYDASWWPVLAISLASWLALLSLDEAARRPTAPCRLLSLVHLATGSAAYWVPLFTVAFDPVGAAFAHNFAPGGFWRLLVSLLLAGFTASGYVLATAFAFDRSRRSPTGRVLLFAGFVWAWEWLRTECLHWPLAKLAYGFSNSPLMDVAPVAGAYGASGLAVGLATSIAVLVPIRTCGPALLAPVLIMSSVLGAIAMLHLDRRDLPTDTRLVSVALLTAPPNEKYARARLKARAEYIIDFAAHAPGQTVVFPETALPLPWQLLPTSVRGRIQEIGQSKTVVVGSFRMTDDRTFNTALVLSPAEPVAFVDKHMLFIFAEFFPPGLQWAKPLMQMPFQDLTPGEVTRVYSGEPVQSVLICQDVASPTVSARRAEGTDSVLLISDLSWFADDRASANQLMMARWRAAETGRWLLMANVPKGAALVTPAGVVAQEAPSQASAWHVDVPRLPAGTTTVYMRAPAAFLLILPLGLLLETRRKEKRGTTGVLEPSGPPPPSLG
ncbi:hypothetical protein OOT46_22960 [Aquabacterium sp. A7-Y]|uniref:nitrilase-related carbon-nitrogen hydrolase n=1 Tax=Aquabacterium sp. A7-Y TaxID=1349605 RepID=UPI00223D7832|nr:nitrilase-related carbon-nitrogen hydrolase [Aquabacterium sp. A7-Y]MCW7540683.1 hypothetical protein [Aquabacterium sp. A7-Y]